MVKRFIDILLVLALVLPLPLSARSYARKEYDIPEEAEVWANYQNTKQALQEFGYWDEAEDKAICAEKDILIATHGEFTGELIFSLLELNLAAAEKLMGIEANINPTEERIARIEKPREEPTAETEEAAEPKPAEPQALPRDNATVIFLALIGLLLAAVLWLTIANTRLYRRANKAPDRWKGPDLD